MKKSLVARGITGIVASLLGVAAVGCGAEGFDEGAAGDSAEVETTSQAVVLSPTLAASSVTFSGFLQISSSKVLQLGGYNSTGSGQTIAVVFDPSKTGAARYKALVDKANTANPAPLPAALGEVDIVDLGSNAYLVVGGRSTRDGAAVTNSYVLKLSGADLNEAEWFTTGSLGSAIVAGLHNVKPCTDGKYIAFGGVTDKGMDTWSGMNAERAIQVFTYVPATPATSSWTSLKLNSDHTTPVRLNVARGYHEVLAVSTSDFRIAGGANNSTITALSSVEKLTVAADKCEATNAIADDASFKKLPTVTAMPHTRARAASIAKTITIGAGGTSYSFLIAGGNDNTDAPGGAAQIGTPTDLMFYDPSASSGSGAWDDTSRDLSQGRMFPRFSNISGGGLKLTTGVIGKSSANFDAFFNTNTPNTVETISTIAAMGTGTALTTSRVGSAVSDDISGSSYAIDGFKYNSSLTPTVPSDVESF